MPEKSSNEGEQKSATYERVTFRLIVMPCCSQQLCWVNPRFPNYCPECGARVFGKIRECVVVTDDNAALKINRV